jgi:hypothetical protein
MAGMGLAREKPEGQKSGDGFVRSPILGGRGEEVTKVATGSWPCGVPFKVSLDVGLRNHSYS